MSGRARHALADAIEEVRLPGKARPVTAPRERPIARLAYRVPEVAAMLGVSRSLAYEWVEKGYLPSIRNGSTVLVPADGLRDWLDRETRRAAQ